MNSAVIDLELLKQVIALSLRASEVILKHYGESAFECKEDNSPLTLADLESNTLIKDGLEQLSPYPINSEESPLPYEVRKDLKYLWLVDPLDGTKDFLAQNGGFTVNIALVENGNPILGVVAAPAFNIAFGALMGHGAFSITPTLWKAILGGNLQDALSIPLKTPILQRNPPIACVSNFHDTPETQGFIQHFKLETKKLGSSLKMCALANGEADIYPRLNGTKQWDTAAADAILRECGGVLLSCEDKKPLVYNLESLKNPYFVGFSSNQIHKEIYQSFKNENLCDLINT